MRKLVLSRIKRGYLKTLVFFLMIGVPVKLLFSSSLLTWQSVLVYKNSLLLDPYMCFIKTLYFHQTFLNNTLLFFDISNVSQSWVVLHVIAIMVNPSYNFFIWKDSYRIVYKTWYDSVSESKGINCYEGMGNENIFHIIEPVSYTHLDVYKRQSQRSTITE